MWFSICFWFILRMPTSHKFRIATCVHVGCDFTFTCLTMNCWFLSNANSNQCQTSTAFSQAPKKGKSIPFASILRFYVPFWLNKYLKQNQTKTNTFYAFVGISRLFFCVGFMYPSLKASIDSGVGLGSGSRRVSKSFAMYSFDFLKTIESPTYDSFSNMGSQ